MIYSSYSLGGVSERELAPGQIVGFSTLEVGDVFLTRGARHTSQWLLGKHGIIFVLVYSLHASFGHEQVIQVLELFLQQLQRLLCVVLIRQLFGQCLHYLLQSLHQYPL